MPSLLFQFKPISGKEGSTLEALVQLLNQRNLNYDGIQKKGEGAISIDFTTPEDAKTAFKGLDGMEFIGSNLAVKRGKGDDQKMRNARENQRNVKNNQYDRHNTYKMEKQVEQYPCRILIPSDMVKVVLGKGGSTITSIQDQTDTKIDIHRDKGLLHGNPSEDTLTSIKGDPEAFSEAIKEILTVMEKEYEKRNYEEKRPLQLKLLAHDLLCGRIIGRGGANLKEVKEESNAGKLIISNSIYNEGNQFIPNELLCTGERVITVEGSLRGICIAETMLSERLRNYMERDMRNSANSMQAPMVSYCTSGMGNDGYNSPPPFYQRSPPPPYGYNQSSSYMGYQGYAPPGYYNNGGYSEPFCDGYMPYTSNLIPQPPSNNSDSETTCIIIPTKEVGAVIGRNGGYISRVKQYSNARVRVMKGEEGGESRVEVSGPPDAQWKVSLCIFNKIKETMKGPYSETQLKTEYLVPSSCVGRIIGKKGQVVQDIQDKSQADIEVPKEQQSGEDVPVFITGSFNGTQIAINRIRDIIHRSQPRSS